jgi:multidrug efflux system membrane fusion protein
MSPTLPRLRVGALTSLLAAGALAALSALSGCSQGSGSDGATAGEDRPVLQFPVEVRPVESRRVEYAIAAVGSVEAFETVEVTARVAGVVEGVRFQEGDTVTTAQVLVEIEPQRYQLDVDSAEAALEKARASKAEADLGLQRRESVNARNPDLVKAEDVDAFRTQVRVASADVLEKQAALELAELNLRYAYVRAPVAGVIQTRSAQTGQYVQPGVVLATLVRREPLLLRFAVPEQEAARLRAGLVAHFRVGGAAQEYGAAIQHVAASADERSRMVAVTARVDDPRRDELRPGTFAEVRVPVGSTADAPVVPQTAIRPSEQGFLAYVVEDRVARRRVLTLGLRTGDGQVEVREGLRAGELLVVRGAEALRDGAPVKVVEAGTAAPAAEASPVNGDSGASGANAP